MICVLIAVHLFLSVIESGKCNAVFRALTGKGIWRWVRGSARIVYGKKGEPEFVIASNWLVR